MRSLSSSVVVIAGAACFIASPFSRKFAAGDAPEQLWMAGATLMVLGLVGWGVSLFLDRPPHPLPPPPKE